MQLLMKGKQYYPYKQCYQQIIRKIYYILKISPSHMDGLYYGGPTGMKFEN